MARLSVVRGCVAAAVLLALVPRPAAADPISGTVTTGGATTGTGPWTMTSTDSTFSILRFTPNALVAFSDWTSLSVAYDALLGGIGGGAPRLVFLVDTNNSGGADGGDGFFYVHWGPAGSFVDPTIANNLDTGNLLALTDVGRYDLGGVGGSAYTDRATALGLIGAFDVLRVSIVLDSFGGADKTFVIDGITAAGENIPVTAPVPEPAAILLIGVAAAALTWRRRRLERDGRP